MLCWAQLSAVACTDSTDSLWHQMPFETWLELITIAGMVSMLLRHCSHQRPEFIFSIWNQLTHAAIRKASNTICLWRRYVPFGNIQCMKSYSFLENLGKSSRRHCSWTQRRMQLKAEIPIKQSILWDDEILNAFFKTLIIVTRDSLWSGVDLVCER